MDTGNICAEDKNIHSSGEILVGPGKLGSLTAPDLIGKKPEIKNDRPPKSAAAEEDTSSEEDEDYESVKSIIGTCCEKIIDQYDFSVKYEPSRDISSFELSSDSSTSDSSGSVCSEAETVAEEAQTQEEKILAAPEKSMQEEPEIWNETLLKPAANEDTDSEEDEDYESAKSIIGTCCEKILDQYDFSVKYEPSRDISSFELSSDSSTSDSSGSVCSEAETVAEEVQSQKEKTLAGLEKVGVRSFPEVMAEGPEIKNDTILEEENAKPLAPVLVKHGVKRLAEGGDKNSKRAKETDDLNAGERD